MRRVGKELEKSLDNELFDLSTNVCSLVTIVLQVAAAIITCKALRCMVNLWHKVFICNMSQWDSPTLWNYWLFIRESFNGRCERIRRHVKQVHWFDNPWVSGLLHFKSMQIFKISSWPTICMCDIFTLVNAVCSINLFPSTRSFPFCCWTTSYHLPKRSHFSWYL